MPLKQRWLVTLAWLVPQLAAAESDDVGFGEVAAPAAAVTTSEAPSPFRLHGSLALRAAVRSLSDEPSRLASLRQTVQAQLALEQPLGAAAKLRGVASIHSEADYAYLTDLQAYDRETIHRYAWLVRPGETYLALSWPGFELGFGERIVSFAQAELLSVCDLVNPRDLREPLLLDPSALQLPVTMTRLALSLDATRITVLLVHEAAFGLLPPPLGEWSPFRRLLREQPGLGPALADRELRIQHRPARDLRELSATQPYLHVAWSGRGLDLTWLAAAPLDAQGIPGLPRAQAYSERVIALPIWHPRYGLLAQTGALALGQFVLHWEAALEWQKPLAVVHTDAALLQTESARRQVLRGVLGLTYVPSAATSGALEISQSYVLNEPAQALLFPVTATQLALRADHRFWRERARVAVLLGLIGLDPFNAFTGRAELGYRITDRLELTVGYVSYRPSSRFGFFYGLAKNDRVFFTARWELGE